MNAFSNTDMKALFTRLHPSHIVALMDIVQEAKVPQVAFVESVYKERAKYFDETLQFLKTIGWLREKSGNLVLREGAIDAKIAPFKALERLTTQQNDYQTELADYLGEFGVEHGKIIHRPLPQTRTACKGIRNLLIAVGVLSHDPIADTFILSPESAHLYFWAKNEKGAKSKAALLAHLAERDELGDAAELAAFQFEQRRVGQKWREHVRHIAKAKPGACFDIQSVTFETESETPRFIEVKAVSSKDFQFYWSAAELEAAALLGKRYFLYLLPVARSGGFDLQTMQIINDPYTAIYKNSGEWQKRENVLICHRK